MTENYNQELTEYTKKVSTFSSRAQSFVCTNDEQNEDASAGIKLISKFKKTVDDKRKYLKAPALEMSKRIDAEFQPIIKQAEEVIRILKSKSGNYLLIKRKEEEARLKKEREEEEKKRQDDLKKLHEAKEREDAAMASAGLESAPVDIESEKRIAELSEPVPEKKVDLTTSSTSGKVVYKFEIEDVSKIPTEFLLVNESLLKKAINGENRLKEISGVKIIESIQVRVK